MTNITEYNLDPLAPHSKYSANYIEIPDDKILPGLAILLKCDLFKSYLNNKYFELTSRVADCRVFYLRYKPGTNCIIAYELKFLDGTGTIAYAKAFSSSDYINARDKSQQSSWANLGELPPFLDLPELNTLLYFYPNDCLIDGLRLLQDKKKIQRLLYDRYAKYPSDAWRISDNKMKLMTIRYKPERRAVLHCTTKATNLDSDKKQKIDLYMRFYGDDRGAGIFAIHQKLYMMLQNSEYVTVPEPIAYITERKLILMETAAGRSLTDIIPTGLEPDLIKNIAGALLELHGIDATPLSQLTRHDPIESIQASASFLSQITGGNQVLIEEIAQKLIVSWRKCNTAANNFVHGDFYYGQVILGDRKTTIIDFDRAMIGDPIADVGNFLAHLFLLRMEGRNFGSDNAEEIFLESYMADCSYKISMDRIAFWNAYGLFQLAIGSFRRLEPGWPEKLKIILDECRQKLN